MVGQAGGQSKPVSQGESARSNQPLGAIRNTRPMAKAACGVASITGTPRSNAPMRSRTKPWASSQAVIHQASAVELSPVHSERPSAGNHWVSCHRSLQA